MGTESCGVNAVLPGVNTSSQMSALVRLVISSVSFPHAGENIGLLVLDGGVTYARWSAPIWPNSSALRLSRMARSPDEHGSDQA